jgi:hypothetical protein
MPGTLENNEEIVPGLDCSYLGLQVCTTTPDVAGEK